MTWKKDETSPGGNPPASKGIGRVHIYGAGIAGMTAAHELALRGFRVRVIDDAQECDETGQLEGTPYPLERRMAVGGLARTQYLRVERGAQGNFIKGAEGERSGEYRIFLAYPPTFEPGGDTNLIPDTVQPVLKDFLSRCGFFTRGEVQGFLHIRIPELIQTKVVTPAGRWKRNAAALHRFLTVVAPWEPKLDASRVVVLSTAESTELSKVLPIPLVSVEQTPGLLLELVHLLPGEHGFRFFPSYYRHLFSTMAETPILDDHGRPTGRTVFDNLVPSSFYGIAAQGRRIRFLRRAPATRPVELLQELREVANSGYPPTDTLQFSLRIWRYLCTCSERRKAEYEKISWWEYLEGYDPKTGTRRYQYSAAFKRDTQFAPRVLAAFDGAWGDARTNGNTLAQLYLNNLLPMPKTDGTLNGPTTLAWLRPWRRYLRDFLKVEFHAGRLMRLDFDEKTQQVIPIWQRKNAPKAEPDLTVKDPELQPTRGLQAPPEVVEAVDYHIIATDAESAEELTKPPLPAIGVIQGLQGFTTKVPANPRGTEPEKTRTEFDFPGRAAWDRFQTLTGVQFFFPASVRLSEGYLYFMDASWALSAINSQQYWTTPPAFDRDGFGAVLSVDIGNFFLEGKKSPAGCSRQELAQEAWSQIKQATELHKVPLPNSAQYDFALPAPAWYHVDRNLQFKPGPGNGPERPSKNLAPYLIPIVGDWDNRPGTDPWDPLRPRPPPATPVTVPGLWQAPHGGYPVHWGRLVFAGTYLKTFTRMTTMESANESARHAVNAIIDHYLAHRGVPGAPKPPSEPSVENLDELGRLRGPSEFRMTPLGEYCRIWDPEQHELAELAPLRELDAKLFAAGLPHVWDVLHLEPLVSPLLQQLDPTRSAEPLLDLLRRVRTGLESLLKGTP